MRGKGECGGGILIITMVFKNSEQDNVEYDKNESEEENGGITSTSDEILGGISSIIMF